MDTLLIVGKELFLQSVTDVFEKVCDRKGPLFDARTVTKEQEAKICNVIEENKFEILPLF